jgi:hypothetical protein
VLNVEGVSPSRFESYAPKLSLHIHALFHPGWFKGVLSIFVTFGLYILRPTCNSIKSLGFHSTMSNVRSKDQQPSNKFAPIIVSNFGASGKDDTSHVLQWGWQPYNRQRNC